MKPRRRKRQAKKQSYRIEFSPEADDQLAALTARDRATILDAVHEQLRHEPRRETRHRQGDRSVKTVEMAEATAPLAEYVRRARKQTVVVTRRGRPLAAVVPLNRDDWEDFVVSQDPAFIEIIKRSEERYKAEGGISIEDLRRKYGLPPKPVRKRAGKAK